MSTVLRCKPGDLAIVTGSQLNNGKIVTCVQFLGAYLKIDGVLHGPHDTHTDFWEIDSELYWSNPDSPKTVYTGMTSIPDCQLTPIRSRPGQDEIIKIAGKPKSISR